MKDYLQPAATLALALSIASLPFTLPMGVSAYGERVRISGEVAITSPGFIDVKCYDGCN